MAPIGDPSPELFNLIVGQPVADNGVGATCVLRLVSRYFNSHVLENVLIGQHPSGFWDQDALAVLVNNLDRFVLPMSSSENTIGFDRTFIKRVNALMELLIDHMTSSRQANVYPGALDKLGHGLGMTTGKERIAGAIVISSLQLHRS